MSGKTLFPSKKYGRTRVFAFLAIILGLIVSLAVFEGALRIIGVGYGHAPMNTHPLMHHVHPPDFRFTAYDPGGEFGGHEVYYDEDGRVADPAGDNAEMSTAPERAIALVGDSFAEGAGVPYRNSIAGRLNAATRDGVHVFNYGVAAYSPALYTVQWSVQIEKAAPTHVVLILYSNDVTDDERYTKLAQLDDSGAIQAVPNPGNIWLKKILRRSYLARLIRRGMVALTWDDDVEARFIEGTTGGYIEENPDLSDNTQRYLEELADKVAAFPAGFTITAIPSKVRVLDASRRSDGLSFAEKVSAWATENGLDYLDLTEAFYTDGASAATSPFFEKDIHLNGDGAALVAESVQRHLPDFFTN